MPLNNSGFFGSDNFRQNIPNNRKNDQNARTSKTRNYRESFSSLSAERWVDIICLSFIVIFLIVVACTWSVFSEALFTYILFPIIYVGSKILAVVVAIGTGIGFICAKFRRRRFWW